MKDIALVYMVAGISSRFGGKIKAFAEIGPNNESLIEYSLSQALPAGFNKIVLIVGENTKEPFKQKFGQNYHGIPIEYALQTFDTQKRERPWGTTDAVCSAKEFLNGPFVVCNGDDIYGKNALKTAHDFLINNKSGVTIGYKLKNVVPEEGTVNRGIYETDNDGNVIGLNEIFDISKNNLEEKNLTKDTLCSMNLFGLPKETISLLEEKLIKFKEENIKSRTAECLLPIELATLIKEKKIILKLVETQDQWFGVTNPSDEEIIRAKLSQAAK